MNDVLHLVELRAQLYEIFLMATSYIEYLGYNRSQIDISFAVATFDSPTIPSDPRIFSSDALSQLFAAPIQHGAFLCRLFAYFSS